MIDRCAIYARYSTDLQTDNSIAYQFNAIRNYCKSNGLLIVDEFYDEAMSGTNIDRPDFLRMREKALSSCYDAIVIYDITRLSRNVGDWMQFHQQMTDIGVRILSPTQQVGSFYNPNDFLVGGMNALIGEHFVLVTREKSMAGAEENAKKCNFNGGYPLYGYKVENKKYVVDIFEANIVRTIFKMYADGELIRDIVNVGRKMGYVGRNGGDLSKSQINSIVSNEKYIGIYTYNKRQCKRLSKVLSRPILKNNDEVVRVPGGMPAIIDINIWNIAQQRLKKEMSKVRNKSFPLKGLIYCGVCGYRYRGDNNTNSRGYGIDYYRCSGRRDKKTECNNISVRTDTLFEYVKDALNRHFVETDIKILLDKAYKKAEDIDKNKENIKKELSEIERKFKNITASIEQGIIYDSLVEEVNLLKKKQLELSKMLNTDNSNRLLPKQFIKDELLKYRNIFLNTDYNNNFLIALRNVVNKIIIQPNADIHIYINNVLLESCGGRI